MSVKMLGRVWARSTTKGEELLLLLALADASDDEGLSCPDLDDLAHKARLSIEETKTLLWSLVDRGVLKKFDNVGSQGNDYYQIIEVQCVC